MRFKQLKKPNSEDLNLDMILFIDGDQDIYVPNDPSNRHWKMYMEWLSEGNQPEAAD